MELLESLILNPPPDPLQDRVRSMGNEFHFAAECLRILINEDDDLYEWKTSYNIPVPTGTPLFTANIRKAIRQLVAEDLATSLCVYNTSWFAADKKVTSEESGTLLRMIALDFLSVPFEPKRFLVFCAMVAEVAAFAFLAGAAAAPEYCMAHIMHVVIAKVDEGLLGPEFWMDVESVAEGIVRVGDPETNYMEVLMEKRNKYSADRLPADRVTRICSVGPYQSKLV